MNASLFSLPRVFATAKPAPYSKPSTAGSDNSALPRSAFSLSNTGSPSPAGTPVATSSHTPPTESRSFRTASMSSSIRAAASGTGQRVGLASTCSSVTAVGSGIVATTSPTRVT